MPCNRVFPHTMLTQIRPVLLLSSKGVGFINTLHFHIYIDCRDGWRDHF